MLGEFVLRELVLGARRPAFEGPIILGATANSNVILRVLFFVCVCVCVCVYYLHGWCLGLAQGLSRCPGEQCSEVRCTSFFSMCSTHLGFRVAGLA